MATVDWMNTNRQNGAPNTISWNTAQDRYDKKGVGAGAGVGVGAGVGTEYGQVPVEMSTDVQASQSNPDSTSTSNPNLLYNPYNIYTVPLPPTPPSSTASNPTPSPSPDTEKQPESGREVRGIEGYRGYRPWGAEPLQQYKEDQAANQEQLGAKEDVRAQRSWQEANQDAINRADRDAQAEANTEFTESQQQLNGSDNTSLVGRSLKTKDPQQYREYQMRQMEKAGEFERNAAATRDNAIEWRKHGANDQYLYQQNALYNSISDTLTKGPRDEKSQPGNDKKEEENKEVQETENTENTETQETKTTFEPSLQDVLNCLTQLHFEEIKKGGYNLGEVERVKDWWEVSHRPGHTVAKDKSFDTPAYKEAVEKVAQQLWNGQKVNIDGKEYNEEGKTGVDAYKLLHKNERGGTEKGWQNWQSKEGHEKAVGADKSTTTSTISTPRQQVAGGTFSRKNLDFDPLSLQFKSLY